MKEPKSTSELAISDAWPILAKAGSRRAATVTRPVSVAEVAAALARAANEGLPVVPVGARSGVSGALVCTPNAMLVDLTAMNRIIALDEAAMTIVVEAGVMGGDLEAWLNQRGYTCGHYPQSLHISTVGGWLSTRGIGTFSNKYGGIENLVLGLEAVMADGQLLKLTAVPRSAAGPRLIELFLGSEGSFGIITQVTLKVFPLPEAKIFATYACPSLAAGISAVRTLFARSAIPALARLYDRAESKHLYDRIGQQSGDPLLILAHEGPAPLVEAEATFVTSTLAEAGCTPADPRIGQVWNTGRYRADWLEAGNAAPDRIADSIEVSADWPRLMPLYDSVMRDIASRTTWQMAHLSHFYQTGSMFYFIFGIEDADPASLARRYDEIWSIVLNHAIAHGGTCTHHHGVGAARRQHFVREIGPVGMRLLRSIKSTVDPQNVLNPGALSLNGAI